MHESEKWKWSRSVVQPSATPWTAAYQAPPSMGFSRQEYWSGGAIAFSEINNEEVKIPAVYSKHLEITHYFGEHWTEVVSVRII